MSVVLFLVPVSLALAGLFVAACVLSIRNGQFDDLESPRWRILFDAAIPGAADTNAPKNNPPEQLP